MVMSEQEFVHNLGAAQTLSSISEYAPFISGYMRGLKCHFHGEAFANRKEHGHYMALIDDQDPVKAAVGRGYRAGFAGRRVTEILLQMEAGP